MTGPPGGLDPKRSQWDASSAESAPMQISLGRALTEAAAIWPEREAVVYAHQPAVNDVRWTYADLEAKAGRLAGGLRAAGYRAGEAVAIWAPNLPEWILLEYACAKAGLVIVALNPLYKRLELAFALRTAEVSAIFHADSVGGIALRDIIHAVRPEVPTLRGIYSISTDLARLMEPGSALSDSIDPQSILMMQYTSGTTGVPKAAQLSHGAVLTAARNAHQRWELGPGARVCHGFPQFHIGGSGCMTPGAMLVGATSLPLHIFKASVALDVLERERCTCFVGVPTQLIAMQEDPSFASRDLTALELIVVGGAPVPVELLKKCEKAFRADIVNSYGMTETSGVSTSVRRTDTAQRKASTVGVAMPGVSLKVVDTQNKTVMHGEPGELCYRGPGRMLGYRNAGQHTAIDADGWLHTGDRVTMDAQGYVTVVGRLKEMIIRGGENLSPVEIENYLLENPAVAEVAVVGLPDEKYGEEVCAVIRPNASTGASAGASASASTSASAEDIRNWCQARISRWKVPRYIAFVAEFPLTPSGKVRKFLLREQMIAHFGLTATSGERN